MCGRSSLSKTEKELEARFNASFYSDELKRYNPLPSYNIAPSHFHPVITNQATDQFRFFRWGLIPAWSKNEKMGFNMINARLETILDKPSFSQLVKSKRCIVPFDGFYEWETKGKQKIPYHFSLKNKATFSIAGLWETWNNDAGKPIHSFTLITQKANAVVGRIHHRMPAMLQVEQEALWLDNQIPIPDLLEIIQAFPEDQMKMVSVSTRVNQVKNNDEELLKPVDYTPPPTLFD